MKMFGILEIVEIVAKTRKKMAGIQKILEKDERMKMFGILEIVETMRKKMAGIEKS